MSFHVNIGALGENSYVSHTLFILYLEGNHILFGENYTLFGNLAVATLSSVLEHDRVPLD